jgi:hypothetical protein
LKSQIFSEPLPLTREKSCFLRIFLPCLKVASWGWGKEEKRQEGPKWGELLALDSNKANLAL